ncbi:MAG: hypothetical protein IPJ13_17650 [Saprospiraceae bacterium]|nr:hypothetical protein [Saprospiraceae bacterium]
MLAADSSRWPEVEELQPDLAYNLYAFSGYIRNQFTLKNLDITPIIRLEKYGCTEKTGWHCQETLISQQIKTLHG